LATHRRDPSTASERPAISLRSGIARGVTAPIRAAPRRARRSPTRPMGADRA